MTERHVVHKELTHITCNGINERCESFGTVRIERCLKPDVKFCSCMRTSMARLKGNCRA